MRRWKTITALLVILVLISLTACNPFGAQKEEIVQQLVEVVSGNLTVSVNGSGKIQTVKEAKLSFGTSGKIDQLLVEEGDTVNQGEVLARLDTDALELARNQAQVALTQAQVALTQAELAVYTAKYNLDQTRDKKEALELALLNAQINVRTAKHHLDETRDIYTWPDIEIAKNDVDEAKAYVDYANERLNAATTPAAQNQWLATLAYAQARLTAAEAKLNAMIKSYDTEEVAIARLQVTAAEMAEAQAQKDLNALNKEITLKEQQMASAKESEEPSRQSVALARRSLEQAEKNLKDAVITAPFAGVVAAVDAEEGDTVTAATTILHLVNTNQMELVVEVDEIDIPEVKPHQKAIVTLDALPDAEFTGKVTTILPLPVEVGGVVLYKVKISLNVPEGSGIRVGMSASADIIIKQRQNVLLVPERAIEMDSQGRPVVKVLVNGQKEERAVVTGISDGLNTEITSGLEEGETVVIERTKPKTPTPGLFQ